jgi:OOP family OmpA-OmpF porin
MNNKKSLVATLISAVLCAPAIAAEHGFHKKLYIGAAGGQSKLSPEVQTGVDLEVTDEDSEGSKLFVGWDFRPNMALELGMADLGEAEIGSTTGGTGGTMEYEVANLSVLYHFYNLGGFDRLASRQGLGMFVKAGIGQMDNDSELDFERKNDVHLMGGLGIEYGTRLGLALRGEIEAFDEDAMLTSLGLLWRFGGGSGKSDNGGLFTKMDPKGMVDNMLGNAADENDLDGDGVPNEIDDCPDSADEPVTATGCAMFGGVLEGVLFESGSDKLTDSAQVVLNDAADALLKNPDMVVEVQAHTDSQGAEGYNLDLSKKRALSTVRYMMLRGVPSEQLLARAFGESKPIESNDTAEGRSANRRVEFHVK